MPTNTPLDSLKTLALVLENLIGVAADGIGGSGCDHDHEADLDILDSALKEAWMALAEHVTGMEYDTDPIFHIRRFSNLYSDGSPVTEDILLDDGHTARYLPRYHGDRAEFVALFNEAHRPRLHVVE
jgi:hypothetical protein